MREDVSSTVDNPRSLRRIAIGPQDSRRKAGQAWLAPDIGVRRQDLTGAGMDLVQHQHVGVGLVDEVHRAEPVTATKVFVVNSSLTISAAAIVTIAR
jgi:hypothetical protein